MSVPSFPHLPTEAWGLYLRDELTGPSLQSVESHLESCAACRRSLEQADPSFLFRRLRDLPLREAALAGFWDEVRAGLEPAAVGGTPTRLRSARRREHLGFLAGAATLLLAVLALQVLPSNSPASEAALFQSETCIRLALSSSECRDLFVDVRFDSEPTVFVEASADLTELL